MKQLHRPDLLAWSIYDEARRMDFNSVLWVRAAGNVAFDPLPLAPHDRRHLDELGGLAFIVLTNSEHARGAAALAAETGAKVLGPRGERERFPLACAGWLGEGDAPFPGLRVHELHGSKTEGELALVLEDTTVLFGDLVRAGRADALALLPAQKLRDPVAAVESVRRVRARNPRIAHVLVGDGWCAFRAGGALLDELLARGT
ncbi:MBL fold metallo-hydrolase [Anaeromyxobacter oryzae]|uniref:MBL fold metallo-hydrolase n=1 Tax=Anaeromyxobacter oryzae TaxID=2918170 RepID=A0ABM7WU03_9BACT|nr:MBL fold metallo-hydrolase [Anaeromyxobacter oryzae]BDG02961.1 hypothetical protein AMOR_19570 [Anaeromyxobacter oryzae]